VRNPKRLLKAKIVQKKQTFFATSAITLDYMGDNKMAVKITAVVLFASLIGITACKQKEYVHVGENWAALNNLSPSRSSFSVNARTHSSYQLGEDLNFQVTSARDGRLWVVRVDPDDEAVVIYPNAYTGDNTVLAGENVQIPPAGADWGLEASEPLGESIVAFIVTTENTDIEEVLNAPSEAAAARLPPWGMAKEVINIEGINR
jgi:hypothetical protein